jgi:thymidylate synthase
MKPNTIHTYAGMSADEVWRLAAISIRNEGNIQCGRGGNTKEIYPVIFQIHDPRQALVYGRPINPAYAIAETIWNICGGNRIAFLQFWNSRIGQYMGNNLGITENAYGYRLRSHPRLSVFAATFMGRDWEVKGINQILASYHAMRNSPDSRQIIQQLWLSELDFPNPNPREEVPCVLLRQLLQRNGQLHWYEIMRSNDLMRGTPNDIVYATSLQEIMAGWLELDLGIYTHYATSLHIYEIHWEELEAIESSMMNRPQNKVDMRLPYDVWVDVWVDVVDAAVSLTQHQSIELLVQVYEQTIHLPEGYRQWLAVLAAEALRRRKAVKDAYRMIQRAGDYWSTSWLLWDSFLNQRKSKAA